MLRFRGQSAGMRLRMNLQYIYVKEEEEERKGNKRGGVFKVRFE